MTATGIDWPRPGVHQLTAEEYHADPCRDASLSASIATVVLDRSPLHAWTAHPKLNPAHERVEKDVFDLGTVVHSLWLEGIDVADWLDYRDWKTNAAQAARAESRAAGRIPLLLKNQARVEAMIDAIRDQLDQRDDSPPLFDNGKPEQTIIWEERGVTCRALVDWLHADHSAIDDLKTTANANPSAWTRRTMWSIGADIEACFHARGVKAVTGQLPIFRFVVAETQPPYAISVVSLRDEAVRLANEKIDRALDIWRRCVETDTWPAYTREVHMATPPPWAESDWLDSQAIEEVAAA